MRSPSPRGLFIAAPRAIWFAVIVLLSFFTTVFAEPPSDSQVLSFISKLQTNDEIDWSDYIVSPHLSPARTEIIQKRVRSEIDSKLRSDYSFKILEKREVEDVCAVIFAAKYPSNPLFVEVSCFTFCKVGEDWKATPLMGRFDFAGYKLYQNDAEERQKLLEKWVYKQTEHHRVELSAKLKTELAVKVEAYSNRPELKGKSPDQAVLFFLEMCKKKDFYGVLAALGMEVDRMTGGGSQQFYSVLDGLNGGDESGVWHKLRDESYIAVAMAALEESNIVSIAMYFPSMQPKSQIMEFDVAKLEGRWVVSLPEDLSFDEDGGFPDAAFRAWKLQRENRDRLKTVPQAIVEKLDDEKESDSDALVKRLIEALKGDDLSVWLSYCNLKVYEKDKIDEYLSLAATEWSSLRSGGRNSFAVLDQAFDENVAAIQLLAFSADKPSNYTIQALWLVRREDAWTLALPQLFEREDMKSYRAKRDKLNGKPSDVATSKALGILVGGSMVKDPKNLESMEGVSAEDLKSLYNSYKNNLRKKNYAEILKETAAFKGSELHLLDAITADIHGHIKEDAQYIYKASHLADHLGGVTVEFKNSPSSDVEYLLYVFIRGGERTYIIPNIMYRYEQRRGDKLLNGSLSTQIKNWDSDNLAKSMEVLIEKHNQYVKGILEEQK